VSEPARLLAIRADLTTLRVDALVNAANETLLGGGGVDGDLHRAAGPELPAACRALPEVRPGVRCPTGEARLTLGFRLPARYVIHTVGPAWRGGGHGEPERLAACYRNALRLAHEHDVETIAFPAIGCGAYGYPVAAVANIAVRTVRAALAQTPALRRVVFACFDEPTLAAYRLALGPA
jgi:O-acetyl-ADP-ribose deacetylase (regulator of RNase III)